MTRMKTASTLLAATLFGLSGVATVASAEDLNNQPGTRPSSQYEGRSVQTDEQVSHDRSGTAGRMGLGADPKHPEGPGNVVVPVR